MQDFYKNEIVNFIAKDIYISANGRTFLICKLPNEESGTYFVPAFEFQLWDNWYLDRPIQCKCTKYDEERHKYFWKQSYTKAIQYCYPSFPSEETFKVIGKSTDPNNQADYYILKDAFGFGEHRIYDDQLDHELMDNEEVVLKVLQMVCQEDGFSGYLELAPVTKQATPVATLSDEEGRDIDCVEDNHHEFKTTIVFPPLKPNQLPVADIKAQMETILKTIAGFMNRDGGELYIGVNDHGVVKGIEADFQHLNDDDTDLCTYQGNPDGFERKIRHAMTKSYGTKTPNDDVDFKFETLRGLTYCKITIEKGMDPVLVNRQELFKRMGNKTDRLTGSSINDFYKRWYGRDVAAKPAPPITQEESLDPTSQPLPTQVVPTPTVRVSHPLPVVSLNESKVSRYLRFYSNGEWSWGLTRAQDRDIVCHVPFYKGYRGSSDLLLYCYKSGNVNAVKVSTVSDKIFKKKKDTRFRSPQAFIPDNSLLDAFVVDSHTVIAFKFKDGNDRDYYKCHYADAFGVHSSFNSRGNQVSATSLDFELVDVAIVPMRLIADIDEWVVCGDDSSSPDKRKYLSVESSSASRDIPIFESLFAANKAKNVCQ